MFNERESASLKKIRRQLTNNPNVDVAGETTQYNYLYHSWIMYPQTVSIFVAPQQPVDQENINALEEFRSSLVTFKPKLEKQFRKVIDETGVEEVRYARLLFSETTRLPLDKMTQHYVKFLSEFPLIAIIPFRDEYLGDIFKWGIEAGWKQKLYTVIYPFPNIDLAKTAYYENSRRNYNLSMSDETGVARDQLDK